MVVPIPLGDAPNDSTRTPWVNYALLVLNVLVYGVALVMHPAEGAYANWVQRWGFTPAAPRFETFFTHMFMHSGILHLGGNMLFLWVFGDNVERRLGHLGYLFTYLACGLAAVLLFLALDPGAMLPLVGASGAIFGVCGFYFVAFPRNRVRVFIWFILFYVIWVPARLVLGLYLVLDLVAMLAQHGETDGGGVAYAAHVGGFAAGLGLAVVLYLTRPRTVRVTTTAVRRGAGAGELDAARRALQAGRYEQARSILQSLVQDHETEPEGPEAALLLGRLLARVEGRPEAARPYLRWAARLHPDPAGKAAATAELRRLQG